VSAAPAGALDGAFARRQAHLHQQKPPRPIIPLKIADPPDRLVRLHASIEVMRQMAATADFDPDQSAIEAIRQGDHDAFRDLLRREDRWVRGVVYSVLGDRQRVDDVTQQVWAAVWERINELRDVQRWRSWVYRLARNAAVDAGRETTRRRQFTQRLHADTRLESPPAPTDHVDRQERIEAMRRAIEELPPLYREALTLRHLEGWSYRQIADVLDVPVDTVETRLVRARRKLREVLEGWLDS